MTNIEKYLYELIDELSKDPINIDDIIEVYNKYVKLWPDPAHALKRINEELSGRCIHQYGIPNGFEKYSQIMENLKAALRVRLERLLKRN